jgi:hypothetical protein
MDTHPAFVRRGVGRLLLSLGEDAARAEGFARVELMATPPISSIHEGIPNRVHTAAAITFYRLVRNSARALSRSS